MVRVPQALLNKLPAHKHEEHCINAMRKSGIPINGSNRITGLRFGFLRAERKDGFLTFTWYRKDSRTPDAKAAERGTVLEPDGA